MHEADSKEVLLDKLVGMQDIEASKPVEKMDTDLIAECSAYIIELTGEEPPSESALEQMKQRLLRRLFGRGNVSPKYRKRLLRKLLIAAIVVILIVAMGVSMMPLGTNDESLVHRWGYYLFHKDAGTNIDFGDYATLIEGGKVETYSSIRQFIRQTQIDILIPTVLPKGYTIQEVQVAFDNSFGCPSVIFLTNDPSCAAVRVYLGKEMDNIELMTQTERIGFYDCGFWFLSDFCQCEFNYGGNGYTIIAKNYEDVRLIVENMKGSLSK